jgi:hypothetical protein
MASSPKHSIGINSMHVEEAADTLLGSPYGIHSLVVYSDMITLREFWSFYTKKSIEEKNELVCLAPFYSTVDSVRKTLSEGHMSIDVSKYERLEKSLIIMDSLEAYIDNDGNALHAESLWKSIRHQVKHAKQLEKNGVSIIGDMGPFLFKNQIQSLMDYELYLPTKFDMNLKGVCMYHQKDFDRLHKDQKKKIIKHHEIAIKI